MTNLNVKMKDQPPSEENLGSFYMGRMRPSQPTRRMLPKGMLTFVTLFAFVAILWYAYPSGKERYSDIDIPVITADKATYKFKPDDPGGMEVPHQDSTVFDPLEKKSPDTVDKVRPKPEEPMVKPEATAAAIDKPEKLQLQEVSHGSEKLIGAPDAKPAPTAKPAAAASKTITAAKTTTPVKPAATAQIAKTEPPKGEAVASPAKVKSEALEAPKTTAAVKPAATAAKVESKAEAKPAVKATAPAASGLYLQFGAFRNVKEAQGQWTQLQKKFPQLLKDLSMRTQDVTTPKGTLTRLQAGRVSDARAKEICDGMKAGKAACIIVRP